MRVPRYLSPSALQLWIRKQEDYYLRYLSDDRPPGYPQSLAMSVGSAFDAYVKAYIDKALGLGLFAFDDLFTKQVETQNRDWTLNAGAHAFRKYKETGALGELMCLLGKATNIRMEFTGTTERHGVANQVGTVVLLGKPDLVFCVDDTHVVLDWKVNGFCSSASPVKGYISLLPSGKQHKDCEPWFEGVLEIDSSGSLQQYKSDWALQLATYAWICGMEVGSEFVVAVDQLVCKPHMPNAPRIEVAQHRCTISSEFQRDMFALYELCWECIHSDHIFRSMSKEDSIGRCKQLDGQATAFTGNEEKHAWLRQIMGRTS